MNLNDYLPDCAICYDPLDSNLVTSTSCGHVFHSQCLEKWICNDSICPICRRVIKNRIKILFDFKPAPNEYKSTEKVEGEEKSLLEENIKLKREINNLIDEKAANDKNIKNLNEQFTYLAEQFEEKKLLIRESNNKLIGLNFRLGEKETECNAMKEDLEESRNELELLREAKKDLENKIGTNKELVDLLTKMDNTNKEYNIKETVKDFMNKQDGLTGLTNFIFVLHQKAQNYKDEIEELKKFKVKQSKDFMDKFNDKELMTLIKTTNSDSHQNNLNSINRKRKFNEINSSPYSKKLESIDSKLKSPSVKLKQIETNTKQEGVLNRDQSTNDRIDQLNKKKQIEPDGNIQTTMNINSTYSVNISNQSNRIIPSLIRPQHSFLKK